MQVGGAFNKFAPAEPVLFWYKLQIVLLKELSHLNI